MPVDMEKAKPLLVCSANHAYVHFIELSWPVIAVLVMREYGWGYAAAFLFASLPGMAFGFGSLPGGIVADRLGSFNTIRLGVVFASLLSLAIFFTGNIYLMALEFFLLGLSLSLYHPAGLSAVSSIYRRTRGKALAFHGIMGSLGQPLGPLSVGVVAYLTGGWRPLTLLWAAVGVFLALATHPVGLQRVEERAEGKEAMTYRKAAATLLAFVPLLMLFFLTFRGFYYRGTMTALPAIYRDIYGMSDLDMSIFTSLLFVSALPGHFAGGWLADRWGSGRALSFFTILNLAAAGLMLAAPDVLFFTLGIMLFGFAFFGAQPPSNGIVADVAVKNIRGLFYGLSFATRFGVAFLGVIFMGEMSDLYGLWVVMPLIFAFTIVGVVASLGIDWLLRKRSGSGGEREAGGDGGKKGPPEENAFYP
ncbi:MAG: MFS transporter [Thermoplasmata archaeon]|nr:MFS transporter [Thermoplasmata archaeon]